VRPLRICAQPGCKELVRGAARCAAHQRERVQEAPRKKTAERGYGSRWQRASKTYRARNPLCVACLCDGRITAAECVDHIIPHGGRSDFLEVYKLVCIVP